MGLLGAVLRLKSGASSPILMRNRPRVSAILHRLIQDGHRKLQVMIDFDYTISRYSRGGVPCDSSYQVVEASPLMPNGFRKQTLSLRQRYLPLFENQSIPEDIRQELMQTWLRQSHDLMRQYHVSRKDIPLMVKLSSAALRSDVPEFLTLAQEKKVPVIVFSAGLATVAREILRANGCLLDNLTIVGNDLLVDSYGLVTGVRRPIVDGINKSRLLASSHADYFKRDDHEERCNVVVLGDSTGDAHVTDTMRNTKAVLKVGFFVQNAVDSPSLLDQYQDEFDIVILDRESFSVVKELLRLILSLAQPRKTN
ncbi:putative Cytosolic 5'-nucleotidase 3A [Hypsibius exemplaris]|uniref:5'-nucleotidase n=1 Tax=Hypsibius exemplaris TaxID=2072580 RepID=A0A1W0WNW6_HYPEX|nr:putative Cytosolic 5'-nucleotidase 3A [Hypsibius exemplaris]